MGRVKKRGVGDGLHDVVVASIYCIYTDELPVP